MAWNLHAFHLHAAAQKFDLKRDDSLSDPDHCKHAAEDERALVISRVQAEQEREK